jgi:hypothetical protein
MNELREAIYDLLAADGTLTSALGTYRSAPAIFDGFIPGNLPQTDAALPLVLYDLVAVNVRDTKSGEIKDIIVNFEVETSAASDPGTVADRIRTLLHGQAVTISGWDNIITIVNGPVTGQFDDEVKVLILTVTFTLAEDI